MSIDGGGGGSRSLMRMAYPSKARSEKGESGKWKVGDDMANALSVVVHSSNIIHIMTSMIEYCM